jgi:nitrogen fixation NifU-like protein
LTMMLASRTLLRRSSLPLLAARSYHVNIVEHYENPRNVGSLDKSDESVGTVSRRIES